MSFLEERLHGGGGGANLPKPLYKLGTQFFYINLPPRTTTTTTMGILGGFGGVSDVGEKLKDCEHSMKRSNSVPRASAHLLTPTPPKKGRSKDNSFLKAVKKSAAAARVISPKVIRPLRLGPLNSGDNLLRAMARVVQAAVSGELEDSRATKFIYMLDRMAAQAKNVEETKELRALRMQLEAAGVLARDVSQPMLPAPADDEVTP